MKMKDNEPPSTEKRFAGMRIDTPLDILDPRGFFAMLRTAVKSEYPDAYIVGEIWQSRPEWVSPRRLLVNTCN
jgi:hypothetical protein